MNHAFSKILIILILIIFAAGGVLAWQYWWVPKEEVKIPEKVAEEETAHWKTYRIGEFPCGFVGYEIKYPPDFVAKGWEEEVIGRCPTATLHIAYISKEGFPGHYDIQTRPCDPGALDGWAETLGGTNKVTIPFIINGLKGVKVTYDAELGEKIISFATEKDRKLYIISYIGKEGVSELALKYFNQMLSTFTLY